MSEMLAKFIQWIKCDFFQSYNLLFRARALSSIITFFDSLQQGETHISAEFLLKPQLFKALLA